jgi:hypothetical protein
MSCKELERYDQGEMDEAEFARHAASCSFCQQALELDEEVMSLAKTLRQPVEAPRLWSHIEEALRKEMAEEQRLAPEPQMKKKPRLEHPSFRWRFLRLAAAAAALLVVAGIGIYFGLKSSAPSSGLLAQKTLARVEQKEQEYLKAIEDLENQALPRMVDLNLDLVFLYRTRLETIDAQIEQCREALALNPANAHIRRYLMAALQDKKETLVEVMSLEGESMKSRRST